ncbi:hypothetical protein C8Q76DRAFT_694612 [Earliella scabrosa]|nr:hypothetical protein C8Q76DRAFT_694612 [Earliella scabrosa]
MSLGDILKRKHLQVLNTVMTVVKRPLVKWPRLTSALRALQFTIVQSDGSRHVLIPPTSKEAPWWCYGDAHLFLYKPGHGNDVEPDQVIGLRKQVEVKYGWNASTFALAKVKLSPTAITEAKAEATSQSAAEIATQTKTSHASVNASVEATVKATVEATVKAKPMTIKKTQGSHPPADMTSPNAPDRPFGYCPSSWERFGDTAKWRESACPVKPNSSSLSANPRCIGMMTLDHITGYY